jgi:WhiB family redox-sensing transcriptional regulator
MRRDARKSVPPITSGACLEVSAGAVGWVVRKGEPDPADQKWRGQAACQRLPTDLFFPIGHGPGAQAQTRLAKEICKACPVRAQCLDYALTANARYGVYGGLEEDERREVRRRRANGFRSANGVLEQSA